MPDPDLQRRQEAINLTAEVMGTSPARAADRVDFLDSMKVLGNFAKMEGSLQKTPNPEQMDRLLDRIHEQLTLYLDECRLQGSTPDVPLILTPISIRAPSKDPQQTETEGLTEFNLDYPAIIQHFVRSPEASFLQEVKSDSLAIFQRVGSSEKLTLSEVLTMVKEDSRGPVPMPQEEYDTLRQVFTERLAGRLLSFHKGLPSQTISQHETQQPYGEIYKEALAAGTLGDPSQSFKIAAAYLVFRKEVKGTVPDPIAAGLEAAGRIVSRAQNGIDAPGLPAPIRIKKEQQIAEGEYLVEALTKHSNALKGYLST